MSEDQTIDTNENENGEEVEGHTRFLGAAGSQSNLARVQGNVQAEDSGDDDDVEGHKFLGSQTRVVGSQTKIMDEKA